MHSIKSTVVVTAAH